MASTYSSAVSLLRFEPQVDLQSRNFGEAQGDIAIRGGIFEGTALQVGGLSLFDPQTGHYTAEVPIPVSMLSAPVVRTGADHAMSSMQAAVGTLDYGWRRIATGGELSAAVGNGNLKRQSLHVGKIWLQESAGGPGLATDVAWARSAADGTIPSGDHEFERVAGRVQLDTNLGETQLFAGYQDKFFGWPNLYTPFNWPETESLQTLLIMLGHRKQLGEGELEAGLHYRRNKDDYEADRRQPGRFNPYMHETDVSGGFLRYRAGLGAWRVDLRAEGAMDKVESTSLVWGRFMDRSYVKLAGAAGRSFDVGAGAISTRLGATFDDTNRDSSAVSPVFELAWLPGAQLGDANMRFYGEYSRATRVPGYTVLNSNPNGGLFRGNPNAGRESSRNAEIGGELRAEDWSVRLAVFHRHDDPMVDWTYQADTPTARRANLVEIDTSGVELIASCSLQVIDLVAGYSYLHKDADYLAPNVDASFYALNFPIHRATLAFVARLGGGVEVRCDNEYRVQEENSLRTAGGDAGFLTSLGVYWMPSGQELLELSLVADNLWGDNYQELPSVPAPGRQVTAGVSLRF